MILRSAAPRPVARDEAESIAIEALGFLAGDPELLTRFLGLTGLEVASLRAAAAEPGFLAGVLAFVAGHEKTLTDFAAAAGKAPEMVAAAHRALNPESFSGEI
ncbi:DUF3572 domain-containing protein [Rhodoblastus acidophilus]|uniref:DUF3572 domain-containing protein n=1 Tax=Candidatus Rhodoblastus alkanivorans TaxID=2954117 RepID=A0ABS9Z8M0_9HYPH|nr:DUF3572 domain-containing protein [Candidatus Rhodoblastus alkanivorans]MCI4677899.1 DUF3572 domain-containing protein [Candidatus Rhodoblastus alkanivorans]MCI4683795.1 DUF3572 domain-containing protein [Candidatus Rhodoblastus alkanivorans]MDI4641113.1 DUF3572 domain-containing protein [Rhodoblastus acidophilus]